MDFFLFEFKASRDLDTELQPAAHWALLNLEGLKLGCVETVSSVLRQLSHEIQHTESSDQVPGDTLHSYEQWVFQSFTILKHNSAKIAARYGHQRNFTLMFAATLGLGSKMGSDGFPTAASDGRLFRSLVNVYWSQYLKHIIDIQGRNGEDVCPRELMELIESAIDEFSSEDLPQPLHSSFSEKFRTWILPIVEDLHKCDSQLLSRAVRCTNFCIDLYDFSFAEGAMLMTRDIGGSNTKFFVANDGSIGIGPRWLEPGDVLAILYGGHSVDALRVTGIRDEYLFIGECYVHGFMNGEAINMYDKREIQAQFFQLK